MSIQTQQQACDELDNWYLARQALQAGKNFSLTTSGGTRMLTYSSLGEVEATISRLERKCLGQDTTGDKQGLHNFALANMGDNGANQ